MHTLNYNKTHCYNNSFHKFFVLFVPYILCNNVAPASRFISHNCTTARIDNHLLRFPSQVPAFRDPLHLDIILEMCASVCNQCTLHPKSPVELIYLVREGEQASKSEREKRKKLNRRLSKKKQLTAL